MVFPKPFTAGPWTSGPCISQGFSSEDGSLASGSTHRHQPQDHADDRRPDELACGGSMPPCSNDEVLERPPVTAQRSGSARPAAAVVSPATQYTVRPSGNPAGLAMPQAQRSSLEREAVHSGSGLSPATTAMPSLSPSSLSEAVHQGTGMKPALPFVATVIICSRCGGSGMLRLDDQRYRTCMDCLGRGRW